MNETEVDVFRKQMAGVKDPAELDRFFNPPQSQDSVLNTYEACGYLRICRPTLMKYIHTGRIRAVKAGKGYRFLQSELYRFLKGG